jgi:hypothetical protein
LKNGWWIGIALLLGVEGMAQTVTKDSLQKTGSPLLVQDSLLVATVDSILGKPQRRKLDPRKATLFALVPGGGQIYNRDYWKLGLVYAALAGGTWTALYWNVRYNDFVRGYFSFYDADYNLLPPTPTGTMPVFFRGGILNGERVDSLQLTIDQVKRVKNSYRRYKGLSIIVTGVFYSISIIEANVAAHLKTFDLSDDLTLRIEPKVYQPMLNQPTAQVRLVFNFK